MKMEIADVIRKELRENENLSNLNKHTMIENKPSEKECACIPCAIHGYESIKPSKQECATIPCVIHDKDYKN
jgi:hypothetical protein